MIWQRLLLLIAALIGTSLPAHTQDTRECLQYYAYARNAGAGGVPQINYLKQLEARCIASRRAHAPVGNIYCNCPIGSRCVDGGNRCEPLGNASDECEAGFVREWNGDCVDSSSVGPGVPEE